MTQTPAPPPDGEVYIPCPRCTIQIPQGTTLCPHCRQPLVPAPKEERAPRRPGRAAAAPAGFREAYGNFREAYGKWILAAVPVLLALVVLFLVYGRWSGISLRVVPNPALPLEATQEKRGDLVALKVTVTNAGDDVPDFSLKSIGVAVEVVYRDGRRVKKTMFPKNPYRGEGALLRGESGTLDLEASAKGVKEIVLRSEVVDLGGGRKIIVP